MEFYVELDGNNQGVECLRLLNEIIADFDEVCLVLFSVNIHNQDFFCCCCYKSVIGSRKI